MVGDHMTEPDRIILVDGVTYVSEEDYRIVSELHMEALRGWEEDKKELEEFRKEVARLRRIERRASKRRLSETEKGV